MKYHSKLRKGLVSFQRNLQRTADLRERPPGGV